MAGRQPMMRAAKVTLWIISTAMLSSCQRASEKASPPTPAPALIQHNDGTAQRLPTGTLVRFPGTLVIDIERGPLVENKAPRLPPPGVPIDGPDPDSICADFDLSMAERSQLMRLSYGPVTVTGIVARRPGPGYGTCALFLDHVRVVPR